jgi:hypothetical protein
VDRGSFRRAVEAGDLEGMIGAFAEDAVLHSPITHPPFEGREVIFALLGVLAEVFRNFRYTDELEADDGTRALVFRARVANRDVEGLDLLRFDAEGRIRDLTVMVRPRSGLEALLAEVVPRLAAVTPKNPPET